MSLRVQTQLDPTELKHYPDKDTQEYPHRAPIELNDEEMGIL